MLSVETADRIFKAMEVPDWVMYSGAQKTYQVFGPAADALKEAMLLNFPVLHRLVQLVENNTHPLARRLPCLDPFYVFFGILCYSGMMAVAYAVGRLAGKRAYKMFGMLHNFFLFALSLYMCLGFAIGARAANYSLWNNAAGTSPVEWRIAKIGWIFYLSKIPEWNDTVLMLLKQNYRQVSFLHVYHHISVFIIWWCAARVAPSGDVYYCAMVNSGIHVIMYGYYFLTLLFPTGPVRDQLNKCKFIITKGQMTQFVFNCCQSVYDLVYLPRSELRYSPFLLQLLFWYMITLLILFGNYFIKNSRMTAKGKKTGKAKAASPKSVAAGSGMTNAQKQAMKKEETIEKMPPLPPLPLFLFTPPFCDLFKFATPSGGYSGSSSLFAIFPFLARLRRGRRRERPALMGDAGTSTTTDGAHLTTAHMRRPTTVFLYHCLRCSTPVPPRDPSASRGVGEANPRGYSRRFAVRTHLGASNPLHPLSALGLLFGGWFRRRDSGALSFKTAACRSTSSSVRAVRRRKLSTCLILRREAPHEEDITLVFLRCPKRADRTTHSCGNIVRYIHYLILSTIAKLRTLFGFIAYILVITGPLPDEKEIYHGIQLLQSRNNSQFLRWLDVNETLYVVDVCGNTLLHWAAALGDLKVVAHLIDEGLDINARNAVGSTPILCAAASCRNPGAVIDCFMRRGANTDVVNLRNETMYSLLEQRNLQMLSSMFQLLKTGMEDCPKLFTSSGVAKGGGVPFAQRGQLGSGEAILPINNTVHFKREGTTDFSGTMDGTGTDTILSNSYGVGYLGGSYNVFTYSSASEAQGAMGCNGTCPASRRLIDKDRRMCLLEEELGRAKIISEYWVDLFFLTYEGTAPLGSDLELYENIPLDEPLPDNVERVVGERFANGQRWLLVQWRDEGGVPLPVGEEEWVTLPEVKHCEAVCEYFLTCDQTVSSEVTMENSSMQSSQTPRALDPKEREELEMELLKIAQRKLESPSSSMRRSPATSAPKGSQHTSPCTSTSSAMQDRNSPRKSPRRSTGSGLFSSGLSSSNDLRRLEPPSSGRFKIQIPPSVQNSSRDLSPLHNPPVAARNASPKMDLSRKPTLPRTPSQVQLSKTPAVIPPLPPVPMNHYNIVIPEEVEKPAKEPEPPGTGSRPGSRRDEPGSLGETWKNASFNNTVSSTNSEMYIPTLGEIAMKGGYKPLGVDTPPRPTSGTRAFRNLFVKEDIGYTPTNLRPQYRRGNVVLSNRQKQQYNFLRQISVIENSSRYCLTRFKPNETLLGFLASCTATIFHNARLCDTVILMLSVRRIAFDFSFFLSFYFHTFCVGQDGALLCVNSFGAVLLNSHFKNTLVLFTISATQLLYWGQGAIQTYWMSVPMDRLRQCIAELEVAKSHLHAKNSEMEKKIAGRFQQLQQQLHQRNSHASLPSPIPRSHWGRIVSASRDDELPRLDQPSHRGSAATRISSAMTSADDKTDSSLLHMLNRIEACRKSLDDRFHDRRSPSPLAATPRTAAPAARRRVKFRSPAIQTESDERPDHFTPTTTRPFNSGGIKFCADAHFNRCIDAMRSSNCFEQQGAEGIVLAAGDTHICALSHFSAIVKKTRTEYQQQQLHRRDVFSPTSRFHLFMMFHAVPALALSLSSLFP
eukprot:gene13305-9142_t